MSHTATISVVLADDHAMVRHALAQILQESGCGWWVNATVDGIAEGLRQATILEPETLQAMGAKGRALVIAKFGWKRVADLILSTYKSILDDAMA